VTLTTRAGLELDDIVEIEVEEVVSTLALLLAVVEDAKAVEEAVPLEAAPPWAQPTRKSPHNATKAIGFFISITPFWVSYEISS